MLSFLRTSTIAASLLLAMSALAQGPATGRLLVATEALVGSEFAESVLLLLHHDDDGSLALLLNRPTWIDSGQAFPQLQALENHRGTLFLGGPVSPTRLLLLLKREAPIEVETTHVIGDIHVTASLEILNEAAYARASDSRVRVFAGHAAWGPGQLEAEIQQGSWRVLLGREELIFDPRPLELWRTVLEIDDGELSARNEIRSP